MKRIVLRFMGLPIFTIDTIHYELVGDEDEDATRIEGGSAHNFERDFEPLSPTSHHEWEWEDKKGFGFK